MASPNSGPKALASKDNSLLVVIDVQKKLAPQIQSIDHIVSNIIKLVKLSKILQIPVVLTEQQNLGHTVDDILSELTGTEPITKLTFSCFGSPVFQQRLQSQRKSTLIITGIEGHICVTQTALDAADRYNVQVVSDAVGTRIPHNLDIAIDRLHQSGITVTTTEMVMFELLEQAGTDLFRAALPLLK